MKQSNKFVVKAMVRGAMRSHTVEAPCRKVARAKVTKVLHDLGIDVKITSVSVVAI